ncbi:NUDIX hydrolase [Actinoplanes sp. NPDC049118]|uniref:NUDIX hydrolase n=1 Tax=Actinoplanes sp. NPDC049118 TaxID=3155769 RepID=UPI00340B13A3
MTVEEPSARPRIRQVAERKVFENDYISVFNDDVLIVGEFPAQHLKIVERDGKPGAAVLARCRDRYALVLNDRYPTGAWEWGIPRGFAHSGDPEHTARSELAEELGGLPSRLVPLGIVTPNSGLLASRVHVFLAEFDEQVSAPADPTEIALVRWIGLPELYDEIADGRITDGFTLSALTLATVRRLLG